MQRIRLRPHHALCMQFFRGHGYSEDFTHNMQTVISNLSADTLVEIADECDDICACCPENRSGVCVSESKVNRYDTKVLECCEFGYGQILTAKRFFGMARESIVLKNRLDEVCSDCSWKEICKSVISEQKCLTFFENSVILCL